MLVAWHNAQSLETAEIGALNAFRIGMPNKTSFNVLCDCRNMLLLAASHKAEHFTGAQKDEAEAIIAVCSAAGTALANMRDRHAEGKTLNATAEEMDALSVLIDTSKDFWRRQSGSLFESAYNALEVFEKHQSELRNAA